MACSPEVDKHEMKSTLDAAIKFHGLDTDIRNIVYHLIRKSSKAEPRISSVVVRFFTMFLINNEKVI